MKSQLAISLVHTIQSSRCTPQLSDVGIGGWQDWRSVTQNTFFFEKVILNTW